MWSDKRPDRKTMCHAPPFWVADDAIFFLTINCQKRGVNQLANDSTASVLINSWLYYREQQQSAPLLILVMPDHLHLLINFSWQKGGGMSSLIKSWKRYTAKKIGTDWQRDYFDHRVRSREDFDHKWDYIINNPVNAGLVANADDWKYRWISPYAGQSEYR
ncbi:REP-associated tyrosine transposase [Rubritalea sp.]|uniref:REP-associated tyrosine transposase n=1 Tax=Rubritalea sp. TaxID=2109375 RepID=UPI003EF271C5